MWKTPLTILPVTDSGFRVCNCHSSSINRPAPLALLSYFQTFKLFRINREQKLLPSFSFSLRPSRNLFSPSFSSMASPSQIPSSQEITAEQNPPVVTSTHPDPASPPLSDSIDALFNTEKADSVADSLTSKGRKRDRDVNEVTNGTSRAQRRRSTRNPRIG